MKVVAVTCISIVALLAGRFALAQETSRRGSDIEQRFKQFDRNGDGKLTPDEFRQADLFKRMDLNGDGVVTLEEAQKAFRGTNLRTTQGRTTKPLASAVPDVADMTSTFDVPYATAAGVRDPAKCLDVYASKGAANLPVMIYVHGGGWQRGDKRAVGVKPAFFIQKGYLLVSVGYRLWPKVDIPAEAQDVADAVAWVHDHIAQHGGDPRRLFLMGHSAGAHLVTLIGTDERYLKKAGKDLGILRGVVELDTQALDVPTMLEGGNTAPSYAPFGQDAKLWREVSPLQYVAAGKHIPPFFLVVADNRTAKLEQARKFQEALRAAGVRCELVEAPEHDHGSLNRDIGVKGDKVTSALETFLAAILSGARPEPSQQAVPPAPSAETSRSPSLPGKADPTGATLYRAVEEYAALGDHRTATPGDRATAEWLADKLRAADVAVQLQEFSVTQFRLDEVRLDVAGKPIDAFPLWPPAATGTGSVHGPLVEASGGPQAVLKGAVALFDTESLPRRRNVNVFRQAADAGAVAAVMVSANASGLLQVSNVTPLAAPMPLPVVVVGGKEAAVLRDAAKHRTEARLLLKGTWEKNAKALNVIGTLDRSGPQIVVSTPYSGWFHCGGERGGGLAVLLGLAQRAAHGDLPFRFTFVATSGHELGGLGMRAFLDKQAPKTKDVHCWLHLGANFAVREESRIGGIAVGAEGRRPKLTFNQPGWRPLLQLAFDAGPAIDLAERDDGPGELRMVLEAGYRAIGLSGGGNRFMHSPGDGPENTTSTILKSYLQATHRALTAIATGQTQP